MDTGNEESGKCHYPRSKYGVWVEGRGGVWLGAAGVRARGERALQLGLEGIALPCLGWEGPVEGIWNRGWKAENQVRAGAVGSQLH